MAQSTTPTGGAAAPSGDGMAKRALIDSTFLMKLAKLKLPKSEQFELGVLLKMPSSTIDELMRDPGDTVANTFRILEAWADSKRQVSTATALYDELSGACLAINRADLVDTVRCEQLRHLNERLRKAKEKAQSCRRIFNEQMQLVKVELKQTQEQLEDTKRTQQKTTAALERDLHNTMSELQLMKAKQHQTQTVLKQTKIKLEQTKREIEQTKRELEQTKRELEQSKRELEQTKRELEQTKSQQQTRAHTEERIRDITAIAKPVHGESHEEMQLRAHRVMAKLKEYGHPELCAHVAQYIVEDGRLDLSGKLRGSGVLTSTNLPDLVFFLSSGSSGITILNLSLNAATFRDDDAARMLGTVVASMTELCGINLGRCQLSDNGLGHIVDGLTRGCPNLTRLGIDDINFTDDSVTTLRDILRRRPELKIHVLLSRSPPSSCSRRLQAEFPGRVLEITVNLRGLRR